MINIAKTNSQNYSEGYFVTIYLKFDQNSHPTTFRVFWPWGDCIGEQ